MLVNTARLTLPDRLEAPMKAIDFGENNGSSTAWGTGLDVVAYFDKAIEAVLVVNVALLIRKVKPDLLR